MFKICHYQVHHGRVVLIIKKMPCKVEIANMGGKKDPTFISFQNILDMLDTIKLKREFMT